MNYTLIGEDAVIAEALQCWAHAPDAQRLEGMGWTAITSGVNEVHATGPSGIRIMLSQGHDIYAITACLALGQYGALWPVTCPTILERAQRAAKLYQQALNDRESRSPCRP